jgi:micrococcal nuclease
MGKLPKEWQVYECRSGRPKTPSRPKGRFSALSWRKRWRRLSHQSWAWLIVLLLAAGVWIHGYGVSIWDHGITVPSPNQPSGRTVAPRQVIDGDTVRLQGGQTFRLVGFNTPETGRNAQCDYERKLGEAATARLQTLIRTADSAILQPVQCSCPPGTHGTSECNYGRSCGILRVDGRDVGSILISEGLARRFVCGATSCTRRRPWC